MATFPPPWELGPGAADPGISGNFGSYSGGGYVPVGTGKQGTINAGASTPVTPGPQPAQMRPFVGQDGNLYILDNITQQTFKVGPGGTVQPANYTPTRSL